MISSKVDDEEKVLRISQLISLELIPFHLEIEALETNQILIQNKD